MICLDASVVGMLICPDEFSDLILDRYEEARLDGEVFIAPQLLPFEIVSLLRKKELRKLLTPAEILGAFQNYKGLKIQLRDFDGLIERALSLSQTFGSSLTVYDASYLAIAEKYGTFLWTADKDFYRVTSPAFEKMVYLPVG